MFTSIRAALATVALTAAATVVLAAPASATNIGNQGCTPGYWKNHTQNWQEYTPITTPTKPATKLKQHFTIPTSLGVPANQTFLQALQGGGGTGLPGAAKILLRAAVAAYLNAAHEGIGYPYRRSGADGIKARVNAALTSGNRQVMLDLAAQLDAANNLGCPLS